MSQNPVSVVSLPLSMLHENPWNPRSDFGDLDMLAKELRTQGQQDPIKVYAHPEAEGEFRLLSGHRRRRAALRGDLGQLNCIVIDAPADEKAAVYAEALTTGRNHKSLDIMEQGVAIQGLLDFETPETIAAKFAIPKEEVKARALLGDSEDLAKRVTMKSVDFLALVRVQEFIDACEDAEIKAEIEEELLKLSWLTLGAAERLIAEYETRMAGAAETQRLASLGAKEADWQAWSEAGSEISAIDPDEDALSDEQHIEAGHKFEVLGKNVSWYEVSEGDASVTKAPVEKPQESEAARRKKFIADEKRRLDETLPAVLNTRERFVLGKIQDKKGLTDAKDRALMADIIFTEAGRNPDAEAVIARATGVVYPMLRAGEETWTSEFQARVDKWQPKAEKALARLSLGQQVRIQAAVISAGSDAQCFRINGYRRGSDGQISDMEHQRWRPLRLWYERLSKFFGYTLDQAEIDAIRVAALEAGAEVDLDVPGLTDACQSCGTEPFEPTGADICTGCAATDGEVA